MAVTGGGDRVPAQLGQVHARQLQGLAEVEAGQQHEFVDEGAHPADLGGDPAERLLPHGLVRGVADPGEFGVTGDRGQRVAQLVTGGRHELAQPPLGALPLPDLPAAQAAGADQDGGEEGSAAAVSTWSRRSTARRSSAVDLAVTM